MADQKMPDDASPKSKAEGERFNGGDTAGADHEGAGITNRPAGDEAASQQAVPERGESKPGAHAGHGGTDRDQRRDE